MTALDLKDQSEGLNSKCPTPNDSYNDCGNEMEKKNHDINFRDETGIVAVPQ